MSTTSRLSLRQITSKLIPNMKEKLDHDKFLRLSHHGMKEKLRKSTNLSMRTALAILRRLRKYVTEKEDAGTMANQSNTEGISKCLKRHADPT